MLTGQRKKKRKKKKKKKTNGSIYRVAAQLKIGKNPHDRTCWVGSRSRGPRAAGGARPGPAPRRPAAPG